MGEIKITSASGIDFLIGEEGLILRPYRCSAGIPTIGIGCTYYENGQKVKMSDPHITKLRAIQLFRSLLKHYEMAVYSVTRDDITQNQFNAMVSLCFNIGMAGFKSSTVVKRVNVFPKDISIIDAFLMWKNVNAERDGRDNDKDGQVDEKGEKRPDLLGRRKREAKLYFTKP